MIHEKYKELMQLFFADEINEQQREELKLHLVECSDCKNEFEEYKRLMEFISRSPVRKVPDRLLDDARIRLRDRLRIETRKKTFLQSIREKISEFFSINYKYAVSGSLTLAAGLLIGFFIFSSDKSDTIDITNETGSYSAVESSQIRNIRLVDPDPSDEEIGFVFDEVKEVKINGKLDDENIKNVLMYVITNAKNAGVRLNSLNLLNTSSGKNYDNEIKEAIISVVKYDDNPGVRIEALKQLKAFPYDNDIKHSYLYVILNDSSSAMRITAINELAETGSNASLNSDDLKIFRDRLLKDENEYVKLRARTVLEEHKL